jgi:phosphocarrier protein HPr
MNESASLTEALSRTLTISNKRGLHARASAKFVTLAVQYDANVRVAHDGNSVGGTSIMGLMMLAASMGETITVSATGPQAAQALADLCALVDRKFDEGA